MNEILRIRDLWKSYRSGLAELQVLKGLSLDLLPGTMVAIAGQSGSGKSTLLHLIGGMDKPDSGQVMFGDTDIVSLKGEELAGYRNRKVGFVFQFHHLLPEFSACENVMFPLLIRGVESGEARERAEQLLKEVGLSDRSQHRSGELSGGEQQRVAIARALVGEPELLLGDEPTGNLDLRTADAIHELLLEIQVRYDLSCLIVTHNPRLAELCHSQRQLVDGQLF